VLYDLPVARETTGVYGKSTALFLREVATETPMDLLISKLIPLYRLA